MIYSLTLVAGLALLLAGAEMLVRGAARLAAMAGLSPLIIGLTVVAFGTSSPELAVSLKATLAGQADIAIGNAVGSNIMNILLILGLSALVAPLLVSRQLIRWDVPVMIGASLLLWGLGSDGRLGRVDGVVLVGLAILYTMSLIHLARKERTVQDDEFVREFGTVQEAHVGRGIKHIGLVLVGLVLLVLGSRWLVDSAVAIAQALGVSQLVISLTIVAAGTSMPELATSLIASLRGERDIAVGNVVGSNIFNILVVLGCSSAVSAQGLPVAAPALAFDIPVMVVVAIACMPIFFTGHRISRWEGALFIAYFGGYLCYQILSATGHSMPTPGIVVILFAVPLVLLTVLPLLVGPNRKAVQGPDDAQ